MRGKRQERKVTEKEESRINPGFLALNGLGYVKEIGEEADLGGKEIKNSDLVILSLRFLLDIHVEKPSGHLDMS